MSSNFSHKVKHLYSKRKFCVIVSTSFFNQTHYSTLWNLWSNKRPNISVRQISHLTGKINFDTDYAESKDIIPMRQLATNTWIITINF
jgi:hypothetical protein